MIQLQNIGKFYYSDTSVTQALRKINLEFQQGEFVAITGESGSGKSTLLNIISGMDTFDEGELYFNGEPTFQYDASDWENFRREQIGFVFQNYNLIGHYSALDNVASALLIMGEDRESAEEKARVYLEKVGLKGLEGQRASELSSGQKQRLSIARALAKETGVIVADEPTGNLDSETGQQIIALLKELSADRLVLMVTHNYEQAEPYVSRKIRLHDGEVVVDVKVNQDAGAAGEDKMAQGKVDSLDSAPVPDRELAGGDDFQERKRQNAVAWMFARMNMRTQFGRSLLFRTFFLMTAVISFLLIGQLYKSADDTYTKDYQKSIFSQKNDSRLVVLRKDGKELTAKDIKRMKEIRYVEQVDSQGYAGDVNYYTEEGTDYVYHHGTTDTADGQVMTDWMDAAPRSKLASADIPDFKKKDKFMRSSTCIDASWLSQGRLPKNRNEIVLYPSSGMKLGDSKKIYFTADNIWESEYYLGNMKVVGFLKKETKQIYFHPDFCWMLTASADGDVVALNYSYDPRYGYQGQEQLIAVIGDDLEERAKEEESEFPCVRVSRNLLPNNLVSYDQSTGMRVMHPVEDCVPGNDELILKVNKSKSRIPKKLSEQDGNAIAVQALGMEQQDEDFNSHSGVFVEVGEKLFNTLYPRRSSQASVYIKNYTKTDRVLKALDKLGYQGISTYRVASVEYNEEKVMDRLTFICIALAILLVLFATEVLILRSIMKIRIRDFFIMKSLGMQLPVIRKISLFEMTRYCLEAVLVAAVAVSVLGLFGVAYVSAMMIYYGAAAFLTYVAYNLLLELVTVWAFNRLLLGKMT